MPPASYLKMDPRKKKVKLLIRTKVIWLSLHKSFLEAEVGGIGSSEGDLPLKIRIMNSMILLYSIPRYFTIYNNRRRSCS